MKVYKSIRLSILLCLLMQNPCQVFAEEVALRVNVRQPSRLEKAWSRLASVFTPEADADDDGRPRKKWKAPRREHDPGIEAQIEAELYHLHKLGLVFKDVIYQTPIVDFEDLKEATDALGLVGVDDQTILTSLADTRRLMETLDRKKVNPFTKWWRKRPRSVLAQLQRLAVKIGTLQEDAVSIPYHEVLTRLKESKGYNEDYHLDFFLKMGSSDELLDETPYIEDQNSHADIKRGDLINLLSNVKQEGGPFPWRRSLGGIAALPRDRFPSAGQPQSWFDELNYKLYRLYEVFDDLPVGQKSALITYLLHGGRHCSDGKYHAITDAYERFCSADAKALAKEYLDGSKGDAVLPRIKVKISELKRKNLTEFVNRYINNLNLHKEQASFFNATWDTLAPYLGLPVIGSPHRQFSISQAYVDFNYAYAQMLPPQEIYKATSGLISAHLDRKYFGVLGQLIGDKDALVIAVLRFYDVFN